MDGLKLSLLGSVRAWLNGQPIARFRSNRVQALLVYLATETAAGQSNFAREMLMDLLWPGLPQKSAQTNLRTTLYQLRQAVPELALDGDGEPVSLLLTDRKSVRLNPNYPLELDVSLFHHGLRDSHVKRIEAVSLYRGDFLQDFYLPDAETFEEWAAARRGAYRREVLNALSSLAEHGIQNHEYQDAERYARRQLEIDNLRESAHGQLMSVLAHSERRTEALAQYEMLVGLLRQELDVDPSQQTVTVVEAIRADQLQSGSLHVPLNDQPPVREQPPHNLPAQSTPFIGRERELEQLDELINRPDIRLVTILGPGGIGKSRLALAFAERQLPYSQEGTYSHKSRNGGSNHIYPDGIFFASLTGLDTADQLIPALNQTLQFHPTSDRTPEQSLLSFLRRKRLLLILDNFEQLLERANLLATIVEEAPSVQLLVTSRQQLSLRVEQLFPLSVLSYPKQAASPESLITDYSAPALFQLYARRRQPGFELRESDAPSLAHLCRLVDGMPLALELAASWTDILSLEDIVAEIEDNFEFLESDLQDMPPRHRSMVAVFDTAWSQLAPTEQTLFCQLSVFRGGFSRAAAQAVAMTQENTTAFLRMIAALMGKSLLQYQKDQDRYQVHELLRQYGVGKLAAYPEKNIETRNRHSACYGRWMQQREMDLKGPRQQIALTQIAANEENLDTAWKWAVRYRLWEELGQAMNGLGRFYILAGRWEEGRRVFDQAAASLVEDLRKPTSADPTALLTYAGILAWNAHLAVLLNQLDAATELATRCLKLLELPEAALQDTRSIQAHAYFVKGIVHSDGGSDLEVAERFLTQSLTLYQELNDNWWVARLLTHLGTLQDQLGLRERSRISSDKSLALFRSLGDKLETIHGLHMRGQIAIDNGQFDEAEQFCREILSYSEEGQFFIEAIAHFSLFWRDYQFGWIELFRGSLDKADSHFQKCLTVLKDAEHTGLGASAVIGRGLIKMHQGEYAVAYNLAQEALPELRAYSLKANADQAFLIQGIALAMNNVSQAQQLLQEPPAEKSFARARYSLADRLGHLGAIMLKVKQPTEARKHFAEALQVATEFPSFFLPSLIAGIALLMIHQGEVERAVELYALARTDPLAARSKWYEDVFERPIKEAAAALSSKTVATARQRGKTLDWRTIAESLLEELQALQ